MYFFYSALYEFLIIKADKRTILILFEVFRIELKIGFTKLSRGILTTLAVSCISTCS